jgi:short-subunit dehydrogenase
LIARRQERLEQLASEIDCQTTLIPLDVGDTQQLQTTVTELTKTTTLDMVIANAGISLGHSDLLIPHEGFKKIIDINLLSIVALIEAVVPPMIEAKSGKIVLISSMASYVTMPSSIAYSTSKRALSSLAEGLRNQLKPFGIKVYDIRPGFIKSEMTDKNSFDMPFFLPTSKGVDHIIKAI